ncbi:MAG: hypothetical protein OEZ01_17295, partial [Candidatus Heimdallarchaeota archaeon]|nr:hypothetical protein [Candidatus Heimdallarchaeota archaeon]
YSMFIEPKIIKKFESYLDKFLLMETPMYDLLPDERDSADFLNEVIININKTVSLIEIIYPDIFKSVVVNICKHLNQKNINTIYRISKLSNMIYHHLKQDHLIILDLSYSFASVIMLIDGEVISHEFLLNGFSNLIRNMHKKLFYNRNLEIGPYGKNIDSSHITYEMIKNILLNQCKVMSIKQYAMFRMDNGISIKPIGVIIPEQITIDIPTKGMIYELLPPIEESPQSILVLKEELYSMGESYFEILSREKDSLFNNLNQTLAELYNDIPINKKNQKFSLVVTGQYIKGIANRLMEEYTSKNNIDTQIIIDNIIEFNWDELDFTKIPSIEIKLDSI